MSDILNDFWQGKSKPTLTYTGGDLIPIDPEESIEVLNMEALSKRRTDRLNGSRPTVRPIFEEDLNINDRRTMEMDDVKGELSRVIKYLKFKNEEEENPNKEQFLGADKAEWVAAGEGIMAGIAAKKKAEADASNSWGDAQIKMNDKNDLITSSARDAIMKAKVLANQQEAISEDRNTSRRLRLHDKFAARKISALDSLQNTINKALIR